MTKNILVIGITILIVFPCCSQLECSKLKGKQPTSKSNSLSIDQIAESERFDVHYYDLDLTLSNLNTAIIGTVEIHSTARQNLDSCLFELHENLAISQIRFNGVPANFSRSGSAVKVAGIVLQEQVFILSIDYGGIPPDIESNPMGGAGLTTRTDTLYQSTTTASLSEPFSAYEWWPCKQSLTDKADSCRVKMTVPSNCKAGSNGILKNVIDLGNGNTSYEWKHNHPIDYYLISIAVGEYSDYSIYAPLPGAQNPVLIQNYIYTDPQVLIDWAENLNRVPEMLELFSNLFGLYPYHDEKYGHCMAPIGGGMEHQTMTTQQNFDINLTAHELGHQWFGNHVTCGSWADIWVNEGFATYSQFLMVEHMFPQLRAQQMQAYHDKAMQYFDGSVYVLDTLNRSRIFDYRLTYAKGAAIIHTFRFLINDDALFFKGLKDFQENFGDRTASALDVQASLENASGLDLTSAFEEWYYGGGYPIYSLKWNAVGHDLSLEISQTPASYWETPMFTNPLEISFSREKLPDTLIRFEVTNLVNQYYLQHLGKITGIVAIDPNNWLLNTSDTVLYDPSFLATLSDTLLIPPVEVFPNPSEGPFLVVDRSPGKHSVQVIDPSGKTICIKKFDTETSLDLSEFSTGLYLLHITSEYGKKNSFKIIRK